MYKTWEAYRDNVLAPHDFDWSPRVPKWIQDEMAPMGRTQIREQRFGDTLLLYCSLMPTLEHSPSMAIHHMLVGIASLQAFQLHAGYPIRGGIDAGHGVELNPGNLYSFANLSALELEQKADWPRVLVGPRLLKYLDWVQSEAGTDRRSQMEAITVEEMIRGLICSGADGQPMIDFLGKKIQRKHAGSLGMTVSEGREFIRRQIDKWQNAADTTADAATKNEMNKRRGKYERLLAYYSSRSYLW